MLTFIKLFNDHIFVKNHDGHETLEIKDYDCCISQINGAMHLTIKDTNNDSVLVITSTNACVIDNRT